IASKFMIALLGIVFLFFWTHSALWFRRELKDRRTLAHAPPAAGAAVAAPRPGRAAGPPNLVQVKKGAVHPAL
ncbi:MAG: hypothetical protein AAB912_02100, partial [Patescibacteria group bacterium]